MKSFYEEKYKLYLEEHIKNVKKAFFMLKPFLFKDFHLTQKDFEELEQNINNHDASKFNDDEFLPYSLHFCGTEKSDEDVQKFKQAVKLHKSRNPHHFEYWLNKGMNMPTIFVIEMVCDWLSFSLQKNNIAEIFDFYNKNKSKLCLGNKETFEVEKLLGYIEDNLVKK